MGNMSYCQFRNTKLDFEQCLEAIGSCESLSDFSKDEQEYARSLRVMAEQYVEWFDQAEAETEEDEPEYDNE